MRIALARSLLAFVLVGCAQQSDPPSDYPPPGDYPPPDYPPTTYGCTSDSQCGAGNVCARTFDCLPASDVRTIHVTWTLQGAAADATSCASSSDLEIDFSGSEANPWGYAPVPCVEGKFSIDKMPTQYTWVNLGLNGDASSGGGMTIDATTGDAAIDLPY